MSTENKTGEYYIERLSNKNLADVAKLHTAVYGKTPGPNFFPMKYDTAFTGARHTGFLAYNNQNVPIALYAVIPCFIKLGDKIILSAQSADSMTHPKHRYKGLFKELAALTFEACRNEGVKLTFGFPNQNSFTGAMNAGYKMIDQMDCFIIDTGAFSWDRFFNKFIILKGLYHKYQDRQLKKHASPKKGIESSVSKDGFGGILRDTNFFNYKIYTDTRVIKINNATLWIKTGAMLLVGDMLVLPEDFDEVMAKLKKLARRLGIKEIHFHSSRGTTLHGLFAAKFGSIPSFPVFFNDLAGDIQTEQIKFTSADIDTF
jgi:hypothetical protein